MVWFYYFFVVENFLFFFFFYIFFLNTKPLIVNKSQPIPLYDIYHAFIVVGFEILSVRKKGVILAILAIFEQFQIFSAFFFCCHFFPS